MAYVILNLVCVAALVGIDQAIKLWRSEEHTSELQSQR